MPPGAHVAKFYDHFGWFVSFFKRESKFLVFIKSIKS